MASRPWRTWIADPSAKQARYMGSTGLSVRWLAMSAPAAAKASARMPFMVRTLGPVSNR